MRRDEFREAETKRPKLKSHVRQPPSFFPIFQSALRRRFFFPKWSDSRSSSVFLCLFSLNCVPVGSGFLAHHPAVCITVKDWHWVSQKTITLPRKSSYLFSQSRAQERRFWVCHATLSKRKHLNLCPRIPFSRFPEEPELRSKNFGPRISEIRFEFIMRSSIAIYMLAVASHATCIHTFVRYVN